MTIATRLRLACLIPLVASLQGFSLQQASHHGQGVTPLAVPGTLFPRSSSVKRSTHNVLCMSKGWSDVGSPKANAATTMLQGASVNEMILEAESVANNNEPQTLGERGIQPLRQVDVNEVINTSIVVVIAVAVLYVLTAADAGITRGWTAEELGTRLALDNWGSYLKVLTENPVATKAATSATVYAIGDVIAQRTQGTGMGDLDRPRVLRSLLAGGIGHGPLSHYWYELSENFFSNVLQLTQWWSFIPKVVIDQTLWGPCWNSCYIILLGLMKLESFDTISRDVKRTAIPLILSGLKLWPLAHCVTYGLVPVENRLLWVDTVEILWVTTLATQAAGTGDEAIDEANNGEETNLAKR